MTIIPYLTFDGSCAEALKFYADALGGKIEFVQKFSEMPDTSMLPPGSGDRIAHGRVAVGDQLIMASDTMGAEPFAGHHGFSMQISFDTLDTARTAFDRLADGGEVTMPFAPTFWAAGFGLCRDRFGVPWMINCEAPADGTHR